jgi:hypothetical protein
LPECTVTSGARAVVGIDEAAAGAAGCRLAARCMRLRLEMGAIAAACMNALTPYESAAVAAVRSSFRSSLMTAGVTPLAGDDEPRG